MDKYHLNNRPDREITDETGIKGILKSGKFCTISMCRNNEPYIVTLATATIRKTKTCTSIVPIKA